MNCTTYIFGNLKQGYSQYPDDYAKGVFEKMLMHCEDTTQIVTHRKNDLMYYAYVRRWPSNSTDIGLCIVFNSLMMEDTSVLFSLFEEVVGKISADGDVLTFSNDGDIIPVVDKLEESIQGQIERVRAYLLEKAVHLEENCVKLPPVSYGVDAETIKRFPYDDKADDIAQASCVYNYTYIGKNKDFDNETILRNRDLVKAANTQRIEAEKRYKDVSNSNIKKTVIWGSVIAFFSFIIGYFIFKNPYDDLITELNALENNLQNVTKLKVKTEQDLNNQYFHLQESKKQHSREMAKIQEKLPLFIKEVKIGNTDEKGNIVTKFGDMIHSSSSMYITPRLEIYGIRDYTAQVELKLYDAYGMMQTGATSPINASCNDTIRVKKGEYKTIILAGYGSNIKGHWNKGKYRLEIWDKNRCLSKQDFTIY
ncbi:MAG: hypothetical protein IKY67_12175 [Paludibacteraceae bacterium]|nr:hypothetical protein [Paludibacteraceae bacterium]